MTEVLEVTLESIYELPPWRLAGFHSEVELENFRECMKLLIFVPGS